MSDPFTPRDKQRIRERAEALNAEWKATGSLRVHPAAFDDLDAPYRVGLVPLPERMRFSGRKIGEIGEMAVLAWPKDA